MTHREVEIGDTVARAARISYIGELGWELYVPSEAALPLYDRLYEAGAVLGLENAGSFAMAGLRIEKGYCAWGHDIGPDDTPLQAGMGFATKLSANSPSPVGPHWSNNARRASIGVAFCWVSTIRRSSSWVSSRS